MIDRLALKGTARSMRHFGHGASATVVLLLLAAGAGCSGKPAFHGKVVKGSVTYNGSPVQGATVSFISSAGSSAFGLTDDQGHFTLRTTQGEVVALGQYQVTITKLEAPPPGTGGSPLDNPDYVPPSPNTPPPPPAKDLLPAKYKLPETSTLSADVTESGSNEFTFALTD